MWSTAIAWLFGTSMGRGVLLGGSLMIGAGASWYLFSDHYYEKGKTDCQLARAQDTNAANVAQGEKNIANNQASSTIGKAASEAATKLVDKIDTDTDKSKETIHVVYRDPPKTAPVAYGSCVHPVDDRVQERFEQARAAAAAAGGSGGSL